MDTRLNSFYSETLPPFVDAFIALLAEAQLRSSRPSWYSKWLWQANQQFDENNRIVHEIARQVVDKRRANPIRKHDLVDAMLNGVDSVTKKGLSDETIIDNMITFLVAGTPPPRVSGQNTGYYPYIEMLMYSRQATKPHQACCRFFLH